MMPKQKPGRSRQCYATPWSFIQAVESRFGLLDFDLAATPKNAKAGRFFTLRQNALKQIWQPDYYRYWLNPPFRRILPWVEKCALTAPTLTERGRIILLVPASVSSRWFQTYVFGRAFVNFFSPRLCFLRNEPYPKDLMLCIYRKRKPRIDEQFCYWDWQTSTLTNQRGTIYGYRKAA